MISALQVFSPVLGRVLPSTTSAFPVPSGSWPVPAASVDLSGAWLSSLPGDLRSLVEGERLREGDLLRQEGDLLFGEG
eukprot:CAMPEP_0197669134 /NCGR_PEP_ID=MMETSP1338-20131121/71230_1 /TAXON_ID=43686 ORGANISM="Pelagodinium beii, Strain RCC1491" /NCGR_SAMPLE_ID=MMETSP1338 /ASSEMBLY_ACC=CAM_ASM_000754 /LENGTH=77 /DNA_ID=CAMNT_0043248633 /DNA_START=152 /DNA_END=381 /DNA_ORIENTATION=-